MNPTALEQWVGAIVERAVGAAVEKALAGFEERLASTKQAAADVYLSTTQLAQRFGVARRAMVQRLKTRPALMALSRVVEGKRVWVAADVENYVRNGGK